MKKILSIILMCALCISASAQSTTATAEQTTESQKFLHRYSALVERITDKYAENTDSVNAWKAERKVIVDLYKERYHDTFTDDELEQYFKINTQYKNKMIQFKLADFGTQVDSLGNKIGKKVARFGKKVSGFLGGMKDQSDQNRTK